MDPQSAYKRLAETSLVAEDLISAFDPQEDVAKIYRIARIKDECKHTLETKERESREIIKELQHSVQMLKDQTANPPEVKFQMQQELLVKEKAEKQAEVSKLSGAVEDKQASVTMLTEQTEALTKARAEEEAKFAAAFPVIKNTFKLYSNITNVTWDYDSKDDVKGYCHLLQKKEIRPFSLPAPSQSAVPSASALLSKTQIADHLWDLMWEDHAVAASA